jgi:hypothetical protein
VDYHHPTVTSSSPRANEHIFARITAQTSHLLENPEIAGKIAQNNNTSAPIANVSATSK